MHPLRTVLQLDTFQHLDYTMLAVERVHHRVTRQHSQCVLVRRDTDDFDCGHQSELLRGRPQPRHQSFTIMLLPDLQAEFTQVDALLGHEHVLRDGEQSQAHLTDCSPPDSLVLPLMLPVK